MDGHLANLPGICDRGDRYDALVMVDDSHSVPILSLPQSLPVAYEPSNYEANQRSCVTDWRPIQSSSAAGWKTPDSICFRVSIRLFRSCLATPRWRREWLLT